MNNLIFKTIIICVLSAFLISTIRSVMPTFVPVLLISSGIVCFCLSVPYIENMILIIKSISGKLDGSNNQAVVAVKIAGTALVCEFASQMCLDMGEKYLSSRIDFVGKFIVISMCAPAFLNLINTVIDMIDSL